jgi:hypothetical protein
MAATFAGSDAIARIERMLFDGVVEPRDGALRPDLNRPGLGLDFRRADASRYAVS